MAQHCLQAAHCQPAAAELEGINTKEHYYPLFDTGQASSINSAEVRANVYKLHRA
jgi:hypothetical protein